MFFYKTTSGYFVKIQFSSATLKIFIRSFVDYLSIIIQLLSRHFTSLSMKVNLTVFLFLASSFFWQAVYGQITTIPAGSATSVTVCQNGSVVFSSATTPPAGATISWTFPGGSPASASTIGPHPVSFAAPGTYPITLTINGVSSTKNVVVSASTAVPIITLPAGFSAIGYGSIPTTPTQTNPPTQFFYCGNLAGPYDGANVAFSFNIQNFNATHQILVNWGDGTSDVYPGNIGNFSHNYDCTSQTNYTLSVSVTTVNGNCVSAGSYQLTSTIAPQISVNGNLNTHCAPAPYDFIVNTNGIPGTTLTYTFPPNASNTIPIPNPDLPTQVSYLFPTNSCGLTSLLPGPGGGGTQQFNNSYAGNIVGTNQCGSSFLSIGPIYVSNAPIADITMNPGAGSACVNQTVQISNSSIPGALVSSSGCSNLNKWCWSISPSTGWTIPANNNLGSCANPNWALWPNASNNLNVTFNQAGTFYVTLTQANGCGVSTVTDSICIVAPIQANFSTNVVSGCTPLQINTINTPYVANCTGNSAAYTWSVAAGANNCPTASAQPTLVNGTTANSFQPSFLFNAPGSYQINLVASYTIPLPNTQCASTSQAINVNVGQGPNIIFGNTTACVGNPFTFTNTVQECYSPTTYSWTFPGSTTPTSNSALPVVTYNAVGSYPVTVTVTNACGTATFNTTITVITTPTITANAINQICQGSTLAATASVTNSTAGITWSSPHGTFSSPTGTNTNFTLTSTFVGTALVTATTSTAFPCPEVSQTIPINVLAAPSVVPAELTICSGTNVNFAPTNSPPNTVPVGTQYTWTVSNNPFISGASSSIVQQPGIFQTLVNTDPSGSTHTVVYTVQPITTSTAGCPGVPFTVTVNVNPAPTFNSPGNLEFCTEVDVVVPITGLATSIDWVRTNENIGNLPLSGSGDIAFLTSLLTTTETSTFTVTPFVDTNNLLCSGTPVVFTIAVIAPPITDQVQDLEFCSDQQFNLDFVSSTSNAVFDWEFTGDDIGLGSSGTVGTGNLNFATSNSTPGVTSQGSLTVIASYAGCIGVPMTFNISVLPGPIVEFDAQNQTICSGEGTVPVNISSPTPDVSISWTMTVPNSTTGLGAPIGSTLSGTTNIPDYPTLLNLTNNPIAPIDVNFIVQAITNGASACPGQISTYTITINPNPTVNPVSNMLVCESQQISPINFTGTGNGYNWQVSSASPIGLNSGTGLSTPTFTALNSTNAPLVANITVTPIFTGNNVACPGGDANFTITVNPFGEINNIADITVCNNTSIAPINFVAANTSGVTTFNWVNSGDNLTGLPAPTTNPTGIPGFTASTGVDPSTAIIEVTSSYTSSNLTCVGPIQTFNITSIPTPTVSSMPNEVYCQGFNVPAMPYSGNATSYTWSVLNGSIANPALPSNTPVTGLAFPAYNANNSVPGGTNSTNVTVSPNYTVNGVTCSGNSTQYSISVNSTPTVNQLPNLVFCEGDFINAIQFTGSAQTFNWSFSGPFIGATPAQTSGQDQTFSFTAFAGGTVRTVTVTVVPEYSFLGVTCLGTPMQFTVRVNPIPTVNPIANITLCSQVVQPQINFSGTGTSYSWEVTPPPVVISTGILLSGTNFIPSFTSENTNTNISNTFMVTPIFTGSGLSCLGTSQSFTIEVLRRPVVDPIANIAICNLECVDPTAINGTGSNYLWTNSNPSTGFPNGSGIEFPAFCGTNASPNSTIGTVTVTPQYIANNVTCAGPSTQFQIVINPTPNVAPFNDLIICDGTVQPATPIFGTATSYDWALSPTTDPNIFAGIGTFSGNGTIPSFIATNVSPGGVTASVGQIIITPQFSGTGLSCPGAPYTWTVTVNPIPQVQAVSDQTICIGSSTTPIIFGGTGTSYNWNVVGTAVIGSNQIGTNEIPSFIGLNPTNTPLCNDFNVTPIFTTGNVSCLGTSSSFEICVLPNPQINQVAQVPYCNSSNTNVVNYTGTFTSNTWSVAPQINLGITSPITGSSNLPSLNFTNNDNSNPHLAVVTVTPFYTFNGLTCQGSNMIHNLNILPTTLVTQLPNLTFCNGDNVPQIPIVSTGNGISWNAAPSVGVNSGSNFFIPTFTATNLDVSQGAQSILSTFNIVPNYNVPGLICPGTPSIFSITVHPSPVISEISDYTICNFGEVNQTLQSNIPVNFSWTSNSAIPSFVSGNTTSTVNSPQIFDGVLINSTQPYPGFPHVITYTSNAVSVPHGCNAAVMSFDVTLMPTVVMTSGTSYQVCSGNPVNALLEANVPCNFLWFATPNNLVSGETVSPPITSPIINDLLVNDSQLNQLVYYNVTPTSLAGNCTGTPQTVIVTLTPPPALVSTPTIARCSEQFVNYNFVANTNATFTWYGEAHPTVTGITINTTQGPTITDQLINPSSIPQTVRYWVVISSTVVGVNCSSQPIEILVTVNPLPQVVPITQEICPNGTVTFVLQASEQSSFTWIGENNPNVLGETTVLTQSNLIQNTLSNDTYDAQSVFYNVVPTSSSTGCVGPTVQHVAIVNPLPDLTYTTSQFLCTENPVTFTLNPTTPLNVIWDLGNTELSNVYAPTTFYDQPGQYLVTLYGINPVTGCNTTVYTPINILLAPPVDFITSSTEECVPAFFQFTNTAQNQGSVLQWNFGDSTISNEQGTTDHFYQEAGCYDVTLTAVAQNGCPNSITYEDMVCAYNIPIAGFIVNDPVQFGDANEFLFENLTVFGHTYFWDLGDGVTTNAVNPGHIYPLERNIYNVVLIATNEAGCSDTTSMSIQVQERLIFYVPNSFTPDGNTRNEVFQPVFTSGYDKYSYEFIIFNRWGETLFESFNDNIGWDGTYGGNIMESGSYTWRIRFRLLDEEDVQEYYGTVNLLK